MTNTVKLLGTSLELHAGDVVSVIKATNQPKGGYFARPFNSFWRNIGKLHRENSILIQREDFEEFKHYLLLKNEETY